MQPNVRAALALSLPVGLIALSMGGMLAGWYAPRGTGGPIAVAQPTAPASILGQPSSSSPPAKPTLGEHQSESSVLVQSELTQPPEPMAARQPFESPTWSKQYALGPSESQADELARHDAHRGQPLGSWEARPIQYVAMDPPANAPKREAATPAPPSEAAEAATPLPRKVERSAQQRPPVPLDLAALAPVSQQAEMRVDEAFRYARRGALYAARAELIQALRMVAQAVDTLEQGNRRSQSLAAGFHAMKEAEDFFVGSDTLEHDLDVEGIVLGHRTPVLKDQSLEGVSSLAALQQYYAFAQQQFSTAAAGTTAGSRALYGLGKVHMTLSRESGDDRSHQTPKAMAFFQAAMQADQRNYLAANELGVLLAQYGQLAEARRVLVHSVSMQSHVEGWQNLAVVHSRMGEHDLARKANHERDLLIARSPGAVRSDRPVTWVGPQEFNAVGGPDALATAPAHRPAQSGSTTRR